MLSDYNMHARKSYPGGKEPTDKENIYRGPTDMAHSNSEPDMEPCDRKATDMEHSNSEPDIEPCDRKATDMEHSNSEPDMESCDRKPTDMEHSNSEPDMEPCDRNPTDMEHFNSEPDMEPCDRKPTDMEHFNSEPVMEPVAKEPDMETVGREPSMESSDKETFDKNSAKMEPAVRGPIDGQCVRVESTDMEPVDMQSANWEPIDMTMKSKPGDRDHVNKKTTGPTERGLKRPFDREPGRHTTQSVRVLRGHKAAVYCCSWSPTSDRLASGAADSTARIWNVDDKEIIPSDILDHRMQNNRSIVGTLDWNYDGQLLVTGGDDHYVRVWNVSGQLVQTLEHPGGCVIRLKWNYAGHYIISLGSGVTGYIWDKPGRLHHHFTGHSDHALDVDWADSSSFASCSGDKAINLYKSKSPIPFKTFHGHTERVNAVRFDPTGDLLATCSDDKSIKIWKTNQDTCIHDLQGHSNVVIAIQWSPAGSGTRNPNARLLLARSSLDSTVRLWDPDSGKCIHKLTSHLGPVYRLAFSPDGKYLASSARDHFIKIWTVRSGTLLFSFLCDGAVCNVCWNHSGDQLAAGDGTGAVYGLYMRRIEQYFV